MMFKRIEIDEACQMTEPEALLALTMGGRQVVLIGDPDQLPPKVDDYEAITLGLEVSLFYRLQMAKQIPVLLLDEQHRMNPSISFFPSKYIYDGKLNNGPNTSNLHTPSGFPWPNRHAVCFVCCDGDEQATLNNRSWTNKREAFLIEELAQSFFRQRSLDEGQVGVMAAYREQANLIGKRMPQVKTGTVDSFQGSQKDVIFVSLVRSNQLGFVKDNRRLNVALTRARRGLIVVGRRSLLEQSASLWRTWVQWTSTEKLHMDESKVLSEGHERRWAIWNQQVWQAEEDEKWKKWYEQVPRTWQEEEDEKWKKGW